jgi:predicted RecA/RadA family phage recombinase
MKTFISEGKHIKVTLAATIAAGAGGLYGANLFGVHVSGGVSGDVVPLCTEGVVELNKDNSDVAIGDLLYWDNTAKGITKTSTSNKKVGFAVEAAGTGVATVKMKLVHSI